MTFHVLLQIT